MFCFLDVLVWVQTFSKGDHSTVGLKRLHTLELMMAGLAGGGVWAEGAGGG